MTLVAEIQPFRGIRYNPARLGRDLSAVISPPYDVISPEEQAALYERHPRNMVRLELTRGEPGSSAGLRYQRAAVDYRQWQAEGTLIQEERPALYLYRQEFAVDGAVYQRRGLIVLLRLEPWERRVVRPHERTLSAPKRDRLELMRATRANFSPIWVLYRDPRAVGLELWERMQGRPADIAARDQGGVRHEVWVEDDPYPLRALREALMGQPVYIADGHHRYETALLLRSENFAGASPCPDEAAINFTLAYLVESADPGLLVLPTHRVVQCEAALDRDAVMSSLGRWFDLHEHPGGPYAVVSALGQADPAPAFGIWAPGIGLSAVAQLRDPAGVPEALAPGRSDDWRLLDLAALHTLGIDQLCPEGTTALSEAGRLMYARTIDEVERTLASGQWDIGFLVRRTSVEQVMAVADACDLMPEKSTYFYPKPATGLVIASLEGEVLPAR